MALAPVATEEHGEDQPTKERDEQGGPSGGCFSLLSSCTSCCRPFREEEQHSGGSGPPFDARDLVDSAAPLVAGLPALLVFRDGHSQNCLLKLNRLRSALLLLTGGHFGRTIPLEEIQCLLTGEELRRVDDFNADNTHCVALSLVSNVAIPVLFRTKEEKDSFIVSITPLIEGATICCKEQDESTQIAIKRSNAC